MSDQFETVYRAFQTSYQLNQEMFALLKEATENEEAMKKIALKLISSAEALIQYHKGLNDGAHSLLQIRGDIDALGRAIKRRDQQRRNGAALANAKKRNAVSARQAMIHKYLSENPSPNLGPYSLEAHLIKQLDLKVSEKTIKSDLKTLNLEIR